MLKVSVRLCSRAWGSTSVSAKERTISGGGRGKLRGVLGEGSDCVFDVVWGGGGDEIYILTIESNGRLHFGRRAQSL